PHRVDNISNNEIKDQIIIRNELLDNYNNIHMFSEYINSLTPNDNNTNFDNSNKSPFITKNCNNQDAMFIPNTNDKI
ncbi:9905_t:CDS:2, partial [Scutellospora calospora]